MMKNLVSAVIFSSEICFYELSPLFDKNLVASWLTVILCLPDHTFRDGLIDDVHHDHTDHPLLGQRLWGQLIAPGKCI